MEGTNTLYKNRSKSMQFDIQQQDLAIFSKRINCIADSKIQNNQSEHFTIEALKASKVITMKSGNPYMYVQYDVNAYVETEGSTKINSLAFLGLMKEITQGKLSISQTPDMQSIKIVKDNAKCSFPCSPFSPTKNAPQTSSKDAIEVSVDIEDILALLNMTVYVTSKDNPRATLRGIKIALDPQKNTITFTASDGRRLASYSAKASINMQGSDTDLERVIPIKCMEEVGKHLQSMGNGTVKIVLDKECASFKMNNSEFGGGELLINTRLISGKYPNISSIIPKDSETTLISNISTQELINSIKIASAFTSNNSPSIRFSIQGNNMNISGSSPDKGESSCSIDVDNKVDKQIVIGFQSALVLSILRKATSEFITLRIKDAVSPCMFSIESNERLTGFTIATPMRLMGK